MPTPLLTRLRTVTYPTYGSAPTIMALNPLKAVLHRLGFALRETGQALERAGCQLQGIYSFQEKRE